MVTTLQIERHAAPHRLAERLAPLARLVTSGLGTPCPVNQGRAMRHDLGTLSHDRGMVLAIALFEAAPSRLPFQVEMLERHPGTEQLIMPIHAPEGWVIVLAPDLDGAPDLARVVALQVAPMQGVIYGKGAWHLPILVTGTAAGSFLVQSMQGGAGPDCVEHRLDHGLALVGSAQA